MWSQYRHLDMIMIIHMLMWWMNWLLEHVQVQSLLHLCFHSQHEYIFYIYRFAQYDFVYICKIISELMMFYLYILCIIELKM